MDFRSFKLVIISALVLSVLLITGCAQTNPANNPGSESREKDELILSIGSEPDNGFDPTTGWGRYGSPLFQSTLLKRDSNMVIINDLTKEYEISEDGLVWVFDLREDVVFSDGEPLTSKDVVYTYETSAKSGSVIDLSVLKSVEALEDYKVQFTLNHPQSTFINIVTGIGIVPEHIHNDEYAQNPIGSGPFKFVQWDKGQQLIVEANPLYYGEKPYFTKISFLFLNAEASYGAARARQVDVASVIPSLAKQDIPGMRIEALRSIDNRGVMFPYVKSGETNEEGYPIGNDITADPAIRKAINIAVDRQMLIAGILEGFGTPAYSVCDQMPWWNEETVLDDADYDTAKQILADGGWFDQDDEGTLQKDNMKARFSLLYPSGDQVRQSLAIAVADMVRPLGIVIDTEGKSWDELEKLMYSNAVLFGWGSHDPLEMYNLYSSNTMGIGYYNTGHYSNPVVDEYMQKALMANSDKSANEYWKMAQWDGETGFSGKGDAPWAWLVNLDHIYLVNENLDIGNQKVQPHGHGWPITDNITEWKWIN